MKAYFFVLFLLSAPLFADAQSANTDSMSTIKTEMTPAMKTDTIRGVVVYTGHANLRFIAKGNYHTYTAEATEVRCDTGIIYIKTEFGYLDLKRNYQFYPMNKVQPAHLKGKP